MHELQKVLATLSPTTQLILGHIQLCTRKDGHAYNECYRRPARYPTFVFQTETAAIFATDVTEFGCAGVRDVL
jgi:hypothetical protein